MQRDVGNEVIIAIIAVGFLAFAIVFAIILSLSGATTDGAGTATVASNVGAAESPSPTPDQPTSTPVLPQPSDTPVSPTTLPATSTSTNAASQQTEGMSRSATFTPSTAIVTTAVPATTATAASPRATVTVTPTSRTATDAPTATLTPTRTPPPTSTATPSRTPTPTPSSTPTVTFTPTPTPSSTPSPTRTPRPTETSGIRPTPTGTLTPAVIPPTVVNCVPAAGWVSYVVRQGDTLSSIARAIGSSVTELQVGNCLADPNNIFAGEPILIPRPLDGALPPATGPALAVEGCTDPNVQITNLSAGQSVTGLITLTGTATSSDFWYYKIEVRPDFTSVYNFYSRSDTQVIQGTLAQLDTTLFGPGLHWIRLSIVPLSTAASTPCTIPVWFG